MRVLGDGLRALNATALCDGTESIAGILGEEFFNLDHRPNAHGYLSDKTNRNLSIFVLRKTASFVISKLNGLRFESLQGIVKEPIRPLNRPKTVPIICGPSLLADCSRETRMPW